MHQRFFVKGVFIALFFVLSGCSSSIIQTNVFYEQDAGAPVLEEYVSGSNTALFAAIRLTPETSGFSSFWSSSAIPSNFLGAADLKKQIATLGLSFEHDIQPLWGESAGRFALAFIDKGEGEDPDVIASLTVHDTEKYGALASLLAKKHEFRDTEYKNTQIIANDEAGLYIVRLHTLVFLVNKMDVARSLVDNPGGYVGTSLREIEVYDAATREVPAEYAHWVFMNTGVFDRALVSKDSRIPVALKSDEHLQARALYTREESDGLAFTFFGLQNNAVISQKETQPALVLSEDMPGRDILTYVEQRAPLEGLPVDTTVFNAFGLDYYKDVKPVFTNTVALGVYGGAQDILSFVLMADASGSLPEAKKLVSVIRQKIAAYIVGLNSALSSSEDEPFVTTDAIDIRGGTLNKLTFHTQRYLQDETTADVLPEVLELYFGVVGDRFIIALYPHFDALYGRNTLDDHALFESLADHAGMLGDAQFMVSIEHAREKVDGLISLLDTVRPGLLSDTQKADIAALQAALEAYRGFMVTRGDAASGRSSGFLLTR